MIKNINRCEVTENTKKIWESTLEDVAEGTTADPFFFKEDVDKFLHTKEWIPTQRIEVVQKNKCVQRDSQRDQPGDSHHREDRSRSTFHRCQRAALRWLRSNVQEGLPIDGWVLWMRERHIGRSQCDQIIGGGV